MFIPVSYWRGATSADGIVRAIERAVADHVVVPGDQLPTVRALAEQLGVAPNTVAAAYRTLGSRGVVTGRGRQGTHISAGPPLPLRVDPIIPSDARNLADGNPDPELLPSWHDALRRVDPAVVTYGDARADDVGLVAAAIDRFVADGIPAERATVVAGALDGVERVLDANLRPGDRVAVEDPGFPRVFDLVGALGLIPVPLAIDERGPLPHALESVLADGARAAVITPRAQNPTGAAIDAARARALTRVLNGYPDVLVVEDDHAGPISGADAVTLANARRTRWAVVRSVAKSLGPDLRLAVLAGDRATVDRVEGRLRLGTGWVSHLLQSLVVELWADPKAQRAVERARDTYATRRAALIGALADHGIPATGPSGLNVWVPVAEEEPVLAAMLARGWAISGGERFRLASPPAVRITIATLSPADARRVAADLAGALAPTPARAAGV